MDRKLLIEAIRSVVGRAAHVPLHVPSFPIGTLERVVRNLDRGVVLDYQDVEQMQLLTAVATGCEHAVATSSGTAALHIALMICGVKPGDEVLMPALTFVASANAVSYCGAMPNFVDSSLPSLGINPQKLSAYLRRIAERRSDGEVYNRITNRRIGALMAVDLLGHPCDMEAILEAVLPYGLRVIEDAAAALGGSYRGHKCGSLGDVGAMSFNNNKLVTTNGGGMVVTNSPTLAQRAWELATTCRVPHPWLVAHHDIGWNYRMGNLNAALGIPQMIALPKLIERKRRLQAAYAKVVDVIGDGPFATSAFWLNCMLVPDRLRDDALRALTDDGIACRALFTPLFELPPYKHCPRDNLEGAVSIWRRAICLPSSPSLAEGI